MAESLGHLTAVVNRFRTSTLFFKVGACIFSINPGRVGLACRNQRPSTSSGSGFPDILRSYVLDKTRTSVTTNALWRLDQFHAFNGDSHQSKLVQFGLVVTHFFHPRIAFGRVIKPTCWVVEVLLRPGNNWRKRSDPLLCPLLQVGQTVPRDLVKQHRWQGAHPLQNSLRRYFLSKRYPFKASIE